MGSTWGHDYVLELLLLGRVVEPGSSATGPTQVVLVVCWTSSTNVLLRDCWQPIHQRLCRRIILDQLVFHVNSGGHYRALRTRVSSSTIGIPRRWCWCKIRRSHPGVLSRSRRNNLNSVVDHVWGASHPRLQDIKEVEGGETRSLFVRIMKRGEKTHRSFQSNGFPSIAVCAVQHGLCREPRSFLRKSKNACSAVRDYLHPTTILKFLAAP